MGLTIGSGITIGRGITITNIPAIDLFRVALSPSTQTTYDATANGNWIRVSSAEFDNVAATFTNTTVIGGTRNINRSGIWSLEYPSEVPTGFKHSPSTSAEVPAGSYIIGWVAPASLRSSVGSQTAFQSYDFMQAKNYNDSLEFTYDKIGQSVTSEIVYYPAFGELNYYILKNSTELDINSTRYVAFRALGGNNFPGRSFHEDGGAVSGFSSRSPFGWQIIQSRNPPNFQTLITSVKQW